MPAFNRAIITEKGLALNTKANNGECSIVFTKAASGSGTYEEGYDFTQCTSLKEQKQTFSFNKKIKQNNRTVMLRTILTNDGLLEGYYINEFGIFATDPDEGEILYSIATAVSGQAEYMPVKATGAAPTTSTIESYVTVSNANNVSIEISQGTYALQEDLEALEERVDDLETDVVANTAALANKADRSILLSVTIPATAWTGDEAPYTAQVAVEELTGSELELLDVFIQYEATYEQKMAWADAGIISGDNLVGALLLEAIGEKPEIDIPVYVIKRGDLGDQTGGGVVCNCTPITSQQITEIVSGNYEPVESEPTTCGCEPITEDEISEIVEG